jgi:mannosyltransferase OCH1-like enzyme
MATASWLHSHKLLFTLLILLALLAIFRENLRTTFITLSLFVTWKTGSSEFYLSQEKDNFDVTFANYSINQQSALPDYPDLIPPILHQISLGHGSKDAWINARNDCLQHHVEWETHFWTDENAGPFVEEKFPHLKKMWESYRYPIQRVDALRYMVLYEYGGEFFFFLVRVDLVLMRVKAPY